MIERSSFPQGQLPGSLELAYVGDTLWDLMVRTRLVRQGGTMKTLHRAAVAAELRGTGLSDKLMAALEEKAETLGASAIRTDTHRKNKAMQQLLRRSGFTYRGNMLCSAEPGHDPARQCFEKML